MNVLIDSKSSGLEMMKSSWVVDQYFIRHLRPEVVG